MDPITIPTGVTRCDTRGSNLIEKYTKSGYTLTIEVDPDPQSPLEWDNLGTIACWHSRYDLGDLQPSVNPGEYLKSLAEGEIILPLYLYDHSGLTINTKPFSCPWDSGQIGFIHVSREKLRSEFRVNHLTSEHLEAAKNQLIAEIDVYDQFLRGLVYMYAIEDPLGEYIDGCGSIYGLDYCQEEGLTALVAEVEDADDRERIAPACD